MMAAAIAMLAATLAQPALFGPGVGDAAPEVFEIVAFEALDTDTPGADAALRPLSGLLDRMPQNTFRVVAQREAEAPMGLETEIPINDVYSVHVLPLGHDEDGQLELQTRVTMRQAGRPLNALVAEGRTRPGRALLLRGLELPGGELAIALRLRQPPGQEGGESSSGDKDDGDPEEGQEAQGQDGDMGDGDSQDRSDSDTSPDDAETDARERGDVEEDAAAEGESSASEAGEAPEDEAADDAAASARGSDLENAEALLNSLEEQDRREQRSARNRRDKIQINKEWW